MLTYHIINPQKRSQNQSQFVNYLSLGSYESSFKFNNILSFSKISLSPKTNLPKIDLEQIKKQYEIRGNENIKIHNVIIPLYGEFMVDNKHIKNLIQTQVEEGDKKKEIKQEQNFTIQKVNYLQNVQYIANKAQKDQNSVFLYLLIKYQSSSASQSQSTTQTNHQQQTSSHSSRFPSKTLNIHPIILSSNIQVQISLIQCLYDTVIELKENQIIYLQKGKIKILQQQIEIKNKGNKKGEQNYIENMVYFAENSKIEVSKGSGFFIISQKRR